MAAATLNNPVVFVVGCQRSGTTMLQRMLDAHPSLAVCYDSLFIPSVIRTEKIGVDPVLTDELVSRVRAHPRFERLELPESAIEEAAGDAQTYSGFVGNLYDAYARLRHKPFAGEKSPGYCRHMERLHAIFPQTKFVHLIRDGREVALSIRDWGKGAAKLDLWKSEPIATGALWWRRDVELGRRSGQVIGPGHYLEIRYEDLVSDTRASLERLVDFLGLPFEAAMLEYHKGKTRTREGMSAKAAWLPPTSGLRDWRACMSDRDRELFEAIAGEQLDSLGYETREARHSPEVALVAQECERWWSHRHERGVPCS